MKRERSGMSGKLKDRVAIVVGAGSSGPGWGNGKCTAITFAREGARVFCVDRKRSAAEETVGLIEKEVGKQSAIAFEADAGRPTGRTVAFLEQALGNLGTMLATDPGAHARLQTTVQGLVAGLIPAGPLP